MKANGFCFRLRNAVFPQKRTCTSCNAYSGFNRQPSLSVLIAVLGLLVFSFAGCTRHTLYNRDPEQYIRKIPVDQPGAATADLAIIEFDDQGVLWKQDQLEDAVRLIQIRNEETQTGTLVIIYIHGWLNNADPNDIEGSLERFQKSVYSTAAAQSQKDSLADHVVGVFLGWRGKSNGTPLLREFTFWDRRQTAERLDSINMRETLFRIMKTAKQYPGSKCFVVGHSMGGLIVGKTLSPSLTTLLLSNEQRGTHLPVDLVLLQNPALDALSSWQFIDFLKRFEARLELRSLKGEVILPQGPAIASITSEADNVTQIAYTLGRKLENLFASYRKDTVGSEPKQRYLASHAEGHVEYLVSHRAYVQDGEVVLERIPNAFNDTPFWIIRVSKDISRDHGDVNNPLYSKLVMKIIDLNQIYRTDLQTWMITR